MRKSVGNFFWRTAAGKSKKKEEVWLLYELMYKSYVEQSFVDGPDLLEHQHSRFSRVFHDFVTLGNNLLRAPNSRLSSSRRHLLV
jgi:hypothetical protein